MQQEPDSGHKPVLLQKVIEYISPSQGEIFVDATFGWGGHAKAMLETLQPGGRIVGIDRDEEQLQETALRFRDAIDSKSLTLLEGNFGNIRKLLDGANIGLVDGCLLDLGVSSMQIDDAERGFSFLSDGPLNMRMNRRGRGARAADLIRKLPEKDLANLIFEYGEERYSRRIARAIVAARKKQRIETTCQLADIVARSMPGRGRIHPATRTFQALRIAVNRELDALEAFLEQIRDVLKLGGRVVVISFHSLEDRMVKRHFKAAASEGFLSLLNKKPIQAERGEIRSNPRSRSAKLRAAQRISS